MSIDNGLGDLVLEYLNKVDKLSRVDLKEMVLKNRQDNFGKVMGDAGIDYAGNVPANPGAPDYFRGAAMAYLDCAGLVNGASNKLSMIDCGRGGFPSVISDYLSNLAAGMDKKAQNVQQMGRHAQLVEERQ